MINFIASNPRLVFSPLDFPADSDWLKHFTQAPNSLHDDSLVSIYFCSRGDPIDGKYVSRVGRVTLNANSDFKLVEMSNSPALALGDVGEFDEFGTYPFSPLKVGEEVYAAYAGWTRCVSVPFDVAIGLARKGATDSTFKRLGPGPIIGRSPSNPFVISSPKLRYFNNQFYLFYIAGQKWYSFPNSRFDVQYTIRVATSFDLINWRIRNNPIISTSNEFIESQASPDVVELDGLYYMFFCFRKVGDFSNSSRGYKLGLAFSTDLLNWTRIDSNLSLPIDRCEWESESRNYPHIIKLNDKRLFLSYTGNGIGRTGIGLMDLEISS